MKIPKQEYTTEFRELAVKWVKSIRPLEDEKPREVQGADGLTPLFIFPRVHPVLRERLGAVLCKKFGSSSLNKFSDTSFLASLLSE